MDKNETIEYLFDALGKTVELNTNYLYEDGVVLDRASYEHGVIVVRDRYGRNGVEVEVESEMGALIMDELNKQMWAIINEEAEDEDEEEEVA